MSDRKTLGLSLAILAIVAGLSALYVLRGGGDDPGLSRRAPERDVEVTQDLPPVEPEVLERVPQEPADAEPDPLAPSDEVEGTPAGPPSTEDVLTVRVVDAAGELCPGVSVELCSRLERVGGKLSSAARGRTNGEGLAFLPLERARMEQSSVARFESGLEWLVVADLAHTETVKVPLDGLPTGGEVVTLVLPAVGSLVVRVLDHTGAPVRQAASVYLFWRPADSPEGVGHERLGDHRRDVEDGVVRYEAIGLGTELLLTAGTKARDAGAAQITVLGPRQAGEVVEAVLTLGAPFPTLTGRLIGVSGDPFAERRMMFTVWDDPEPDYNRPLRALTYFGGDTDVEGRFEIPCSFASRLSPEAEMVIAFERGNSADTDEPAAVRFSLPEIAPHGATDLGDLRLQPLPVLVAGVVVDEHGAPVKNARIVVRYSRGEGRGRRWFNLDRGVVLSDANGAFEFRSSQRLPEIGLRASKRSRHSADLRGIAPGRTGLVVELPSKGVVVHRGSVTATVLIDEGVSPLELEFILEHSGGRQLDSWSWQREVVFQRLPPGAYELRVRTRETHWPLLVIEDLDVPPDGPAQDARLQGLDLRGAVVLFSFLLKDEHGRSLREMSVQVSDEQGRGGRLHTDEDGRLLVLAPRDLAAVRISPRDYAERTVQLTGGEPELSFERED